MSKYCALLRGVRIGPTTTLRMTENGAAQTRTFIDPATSAAILSTKFFYLRGDGADDDLARAFRLTADSHTGGTNVYATAVAYSIDPAAISGSLTISIASGGPHNFMFSFADALTTFDEGAVGFTDANTANNASAKVGTLSPSAAWVSPEVFARCEQVTEYDVSVKRARSGRIKALRYGGPYDLRELRHEMVDSRRLLDQDNTSDPTATLDRFIQTVGAGDRFEMHWATASGSVLSALSSSTRIGTAWHFDEMSSAKLRPERLQPGLALYGFDLGLLGYVA